MRQFVCETRSPLFAEGCEGGRGDFGVARPDSLVVDTLADEDDADYSAGDLSLREALRLLADGGTVTFALSLAGGTITLSGSQLTLSRDVTISGLGAERLTVSGDDLSRVFQVDGGVAARLSGLTITKGRRYAEGGGIYNAGTLTVIGSALTANYADYGGGIFNVGTLTVSVTTLIENGGRLRGGAVYNQAGGTATIGGSILAENSGHGGGAVWNDGGTLIVDRSTFSDNVANAVGGAIGNFNGTAIVSRSTLFANFAGYKGGAIDNDGASTVGQSTISENTSTGLGGGIDNDGTSTVGQSTVTGNLGGGIRATAARRRSATRS